MTLRGTSESARLGLKSTDRPDRWSLDPGSNYTIEYVEVQDGVNLGDTLINPANSVNLENNVFWFTGDPATVAEADGTSSSATPGGLGGRRGFGGEGGGGGEIIISVIPADRTWEYGGASASDAEAEAEASDRPRGATDFSDQPSPRLRPADQRGRSPAGDAHAPPRTRATILSDDISTTRSLELQRALRRLARIERNERMEDRATEIVRRVLPQTPQVITQDMFRRAPISRRHATAPEKFDSLLIDILSSIKIGFLDNFDRTSKELAGSFEKTGASGKIVESSESMITRMMGAPADIARRVIAGTHLERVVDAITRNVGENMLARRSVKESSQLLTDTLIERGARTARKLSRLEKVIPERDMIARRLYPTKLMLADEDSDELIVEELRIALEGHHGIPYAYVPTTLFSAPQRSMTDKHGVAKFLNVLTGEHRLEARINNSFTLHKKITIEAPEGIDVTPEEPVEVLIPMISIIVEEPTHGAAPGTEKRLKRQALIAGGLLGVLLVQVFVWLLVIEVRRRRNGSACAL